jgi:hypothetical protein
MRVPRNCFSAGVALFVFVLCCSRIALATGTIHFRNVDLGDQYILTQPVAYFDIYNDGPDTVLVTGVTLPGADTNIFKLLLRADTVRVVPLKFTPIGVLLNLSDTIDYTATVNIANTGTDSLITGTLHARGRMVSGTAKLGNGIDSAHIGEYFTVPLVVTQFSDPIGACFIQNYRIELMYDPTLITLDTSAMTVGRDTQGVSAGYLFLYDVPYTAGHVTFHATGFTQGIHQAGDTICKFTFQANQVLFAARSDVTVNIFGGDGFLFARFPLVEKFTFIAQPCIGNAVPLYAAVTGRLLGNHPNPFNPTTQVRFRADATGYMRVEVFDRIGRRVATLVDGIVEAGDHTVEFRSTELPSGTYLCRLFTPLVNDVRTMSLSR